MPQHRVALLEKKKSPQRLRLFFSAVLRGVIFKHQHPNLQEQPTLKIVQSPPGYAHFFRRLPRKIPVKNNFFGWQSSKKIERTIEDNQGSLGKIGMPGHFWKAILMELKSYFFQMKNKN